MRSSSSSCATSRALSAAGICKLPAQRSLHRTTGSLCQAAGCPRCSTSHNFQQLRAHSAARKKVPEADSGPPRLEQTHTLKGVVRSSSEPGRGVAVPISAPGAAQNKKPAGD
jgi:hypothetical protein